MRDCRVQLIGVGGGGAHALERLKARFHETPDLALAHTNEAVLQECSIERRVLIGAEVTERLSSGGDPAVGRRAAESSADALRDLCADADLVIVVAALGGGTGGGAAPLVCRYAREAGALTLGVCALPFFFEGVERRRRAEESLAAVRAEADAVILFPNQRLFEWVGENAPLARAFEVADDVIASGLRSLWRLLTQRWLIHVDLADFRRLARSGNRVLSMAAFETSGEQRVAEALSRLRDSPLLDRGNALATARALLVAVLGGPDLSLNEFDRLIRGVGEASHPEAQLHIGAAVDPEYEGRLGLTLFCAEQAPTEPEAAVAPAAAPEPASASKPDEPTAAKPSAPPRTAGKIVQGTLPIEAPGKGRFKDVEPTLIDGEDLDVPTFMRRGLKLSRSP